VEPFRPDNYVTRVEGGAVVLGQFRAPTDDGRRWLLVANRSDRTDTTVHLTFGAAAARREQFRASSRDYAAAAAAPVSLQLAAGGAALFRLGPQTASPVGRRR
jgi:hypothetical protein